jgi:1-deoxyxylulose-5-phosphate synthase
MIKATRREFLRASITGAGVCLVPSVFSADSTKAVAAIPTAADRVMLGKTGIRASFLAQGTGFNGSARSSDHTRMGEKAFDTLLRHSMDDGVNFLDMADLYGTHPFVRSVIKGIPRDRYVLLTKIWPRKENWVTPSGGAVQEIDRFRQELGVDMVDVCLIHCMVNDKWPQEYARTRDELSALKQKGVVRAVGVSCHDFGALKVASQNPWVDVIFARINNKGGSEYMMDGTCDEVSAVLKQARANGKAVVGMKIFGAGKLTSAEQMDASLRYVLGNHLVDAMTIGMLSTEQVDDTVKRIDQTAKALA